MEPDGSPSQVHDHEKVLTGGKTTRPVQAPHVDRLEGLARDTPLWQLKPSDQFCPNVLRSTSQVAPAAMSLSHTLSSGARLSSAMVIM